MHYILTLLQAGPPVKGREDGERHLRLVAEEPSTDTVFGSPDRPPERPCRAISLRILVAVRSVILVDCADSSPPDMTYLPSHTAFPPNHVPTTLVPRILAAVTLMMSVSSTTKSAHFPTSSDPIVDS